MRMIFIIFACVMLLCIAFWVGCIVGADSEIEISKDIFTHYKSMEEAYINGKKVGFSQGWEMCADYCIEKFCWNQKDWNKKHKEEIEREINLIMISVLQKNQENRGKNDREETRMRKLPKGYNLQNGDRK